MTEQAGNTEAVGPIRAIVIDVGDLAKSGEFYSALLGVGIRSQSGEYLSLEPQGAGPAVLLQKVPESKTAKNRVHIDLAVDDLEASLARAEAIGARLVQRFDAHNVNFIVLADPDGNEFCLVDYGD